MDHGFKGQLPLSQAAAERVLFRALTDIAETQSSVLIDSIESYVTDFDELGSLIDEIEIELSEIPGFAFRKAQGAVLSAPRAAHHDVLIWLLEDAERS